MVDLGPPQNSAAEEARSPQQSLKLIKTRWSSLNHSSPTKVIMCHNIYPAHKMGCCKHHWNSLNVIEFGFFVTPKRENGVVNLQQSLNFIEIHWIDHHPKNWQPQQIIETH